MFLLNLQSKVPIYLQIQEQITKFIQAGILHPGDKLPSVRQLAVDNGINPNTVAKAYTQLESSGIVYNVPKKGVYVAEAKKDASRMELLKKQLESLMEKGYTEEEVLAAIAEIRQRKDGSNAGN